MNFSNLGIQTAELFWQYRIFFKFLGFVKKAQANINKTDGFQNINKLSIRFSYMPTLPIYAVVYRIFKSSTDFRCFPTDLKKNVKKLS